jgi:hypothetical protein
MTKILIGELEVYESGNIVSTEKKILITLQSENPFTLEVELSFPEEEKETKMEAYQIEQVGIGIRLINFNNSLGTGNIKPMKIGWFNGRSLFINYRLIPINKNEGGVFNYTFLLGKIVDETGNESE